MGEVVTEGLVLVVRAIHVTYRLAGVDDAHRDAALRAHEHHAASCPVARSIGSAIEITTELVFVDD